MRLIRWISILMLMSGVGCGTSQPPPRLDVTPTLDDDVIVYSPTPTSTITSTPTNTAIPPVYTPFERRPLPATWTYTPTPTPTLSPTPSATPTITYTPSPTATRTIAELCEAFTGIIIYDPTRAYLRDAVLRVFFGIDDPAYVIIFEAKERATGEMLTYELYTYGLYQMGELLLETFPVVGTYDWVFYLQNEAGEQLCPIRGEITLRERTLFDYIPTATASR